MKMTVRKSWKRLIAVTWIAWLLVLTACAPRTVYVRGESQPLPIRQGQSAPADGWLLSDAALADLLACCERFLEP